MMEFKALEFPDEQLVTANGIIGNKVIALNGDHIGKIDDLYINPKDLNVEAVKVNKGILKCDLYVGKNYINRLDGDAALLNITPLEEIVGKDVYDSNGKKIGTVWKVKSIGATNKLVSIVVSQEDCKIDLDISEDKVKSVGESILLKAPLEEIIQQVAKRHKKAKEDSV
jgi:sporulation protein YlmC with PRC-barrel domain